MAMMTSFATAALAFSTSPVPPHAVHMRAPAAHMMVDPVIDGFMIAGLTVMAVEAFSDKATNRAFMKEYVTAPVATDAYTLAKRLDDADNQDMQIAFEQMSEEEVQAREASADEVFARAAAVLAAGLVIASPRDRLASSLDQAELVD